MLINACARPLSDLMSCSPRSGEFLKGSKSSGKNILLKVSLRNDKDLANIDKALQRGVVRCCLTCLGLTLLPLYCLVRPVFTVCCACVFRLLAVALPATSGRVVCSYHTVVLS